jgi:hypothetical protein
MTVTSSFQNSRQIPPEKKLEHLLAAQARWQSFYGEPNENLKAEIKKARKAVKDERNASSNPNAGSNSSGLYDR